MTKSSSWDTSPLEDWDGPRRKIRYEEFLAEYDRLHNAWAYGDMPAENLAGEMTRLREFIPWIDRADRRDWAEDLLVRWQSAATGEHGERMGRAFAVLARVHRAEGTPEERLAAYRQGIADIAVIADEAEDESEQDAICGYNCLLGMLIDGIEYDEQQLMEQERAGEIQPSDVGD